MLKISTSDIGFLLDGSQANVEKQWFDCKSQLVICFDWSMLSTVRNNGFSQQLWQLGKAQSLNLPTNELALTS